MALNTRYLVLANPINDESEAEGVTNEIIEAFQDIQASVDAWFNLDRLIVTVQGSAPSAQVREVLGNLGHDIEASWLSDRPSGRKLTVNLEYDDEKQVVSAAIDEGLLISALAGGMPDHGDRRLMAAVTALATENDFTWGYGPMSGNMSLQDIMTEVRFWNRDEAILWSEANWDPEEPMLEISFRPEADLPGGTIVEVEVMNMETSWSMPLRLLPEGFDPEDDGCLDDLARLPCAPEKVRVWTELMPFTVTIDNPEIIPEPDETPSP